MPTSTPMTSSARSPARPRPPNAYAKRSTTSGAPRPRWLPKAAKPGERLLRLGRVQAFLDVAQDNGLTGVALDDIRAATDGSALGPSTGSVADYGISHVPVAGAINDIADGMGIDAGDGIDWLLEQLGADSPDAFDSLSDAEKIDRIRRESSRLDREVWVALDRFDSDPAVRDAARGEPFVDGAGALQVRLDPGGGPGLPSWAGSLAIYGRPTHADAESIASGIGDIASPPAGLFLRGRR